MRTAKQITAKIMMIAAMAIILLHTVVPHHHHDCHAEGMVLESELLCQESHDGCCHHKHDGEGESHHPFDQCKLQQLLAQLTLSDREDKIYAADLLHHIEMDLAPWHTPLAEIHIVECLTSVVIPDTALPDAPMLSGISLRGPPTV